MLVCVSGPPKTWALSGCLRRFRSIICPYLEPANGVGVNESVRRLKSVKRLKRDEQDLCRIRANKAVQERAHFDGHNLGDCRGKWN